MKLQPGETKCGEKENKGEDQAQDTWLDFPALPRPHPSGRAAGERPHDFPLQIAEDKVNKSPPAYTWECRKVRITSPVPGLHLFATLVFTFSLPLFFTIFCFYLFSFYSNWHLSLSPWVGPSKYRAIHSSERGLRSWTSSSVETWCLRLWTWQALLVLDRWLNLLTS